MGRIVLAFQVFFRILCNADFARHARWLAEGGLPPPEAPPPPREPVTKKEPVSIPSPRPPAPPSALLLLAALQREARLVDFLKEPLAGFSDAQIGAAARDVHRDCAAVLERMFALQPIVTDAEGAQVTVPAGFDAAQYRLTGNVTSQAPLRGALVHHGWRATRSELPEWTGSEEAARIIAPVEVEVR
jgi:hypothetical protein